jgi:hypothetical protein
VLGKVRKSPFSRIKSLVADITHEEARARGYIKGTLKKEEFFGLTRRVTTPSTIYKKQKLDRDDIIDITDFDVVLWLKGEMRLMLEEELARAILIGDGRAATTRTRSRTPPGPTRARAFARSSTTTTSTPRRSSSTSTVTSRTRASSTRSSARCSSTRARASRRSTRPCRQ